MDQVTHQVPPGFVWPTVGHPGRSPLWAIVANPNQPRTESGFGDEELDSLADTMRPENKGEQREIATVRELYTVEHERYPARVRYMLISGERRWRSAGLANLADLEIRVKRYESQADEEFDMYMLNEKRVGLSDIENAHYLARIMLNYNLKTQEQLAKKVGKSQKEVSQLLSLLKLSPNARARMSPKLPDYAKLKRQVGVFLSHLEHSVQDDFLESMPQDRATAGQQIRWMQAELMDKAVVLPTKLASPADLRDVFGYFADQIHRRAGELLAKPNKHRLFENVKEGQAEALVLKLTDAGNLLHNLLAEVYELAGLKPDPQPVSKPPLSTAIGKPPVTPKQEGSKEGFSGQLPPIKYYDFSTGGSKEREISLAFYLKLWKLGNLLFQVKGEPKPDNYPTDDEVIGRLEAMGER